MKMINRIIEPTSGSIKIDGEDVLSLDQNTLRRRIGYVIQQIGLFPHMTIAENVSVVPLSIGLRTFDITKFMPSFLPSQHN
jgi:osmoprotectant transport system ATP-binding protein